MSHRQAPAPHITLVAAGVYHSADNGVYEEGVFSRAEEGVAAAGRDVSKREMASNTRRYRVICYKHDGDMAIRQAAKQAIKQWRRRASGKPRHSYSCAGTLQISLRDALEENRIRGR